MIYNFRKFFEMQNVKYDYSSTQINVPQPLANELINWGNKKIKNSEIFVSQTDPSFGREDEMHVTVLYGIHSDSHKEIEKCLSGTKPITVKLGKIDVFTNPENFDVVVVDVISKELHELNSLLTKSVEFTNKYKEYKPHITIAYVKKGKGIKYKGIDAFKGKEFTSDSIIFSSKTGIKKTINVR